MSAGFWIEPFYRKKCEGPRPGVEPGSGDPQPPRITATLPRPQIRYEDISKWAYLTFSGKPEPERSEGGFLGRAFLHKKVRIARGGVEPPSSAPKAEMIGRYTTGLLRHFYISSHIIKIATVGQETRSNAAVSSETRANERSE